MAILISAIEVGSVRSLIPVLLELVKSHKLFIESKGYFKENLPQKLRGSLVYIPNHENLIKEFILKKDIKVVLFSVNVHNTRPLQIARIAKSLQLPTLHLLDYWNGYRSRMELDGKKLFNPTKYLVLDDYSKQEAEKDGIQSKIIQVVGQPAFSDLAIKYFQESKKEDPFKKIKETGLKVVLFALEPVEDDQGSCIEDNKNYRGYIEYDVIKILINSLIKINKGYRIIVLPHPRQNLEKLKKQWQQCGGEQFGFVCDYQRGRNLLPFVHGVVGMASTLLYEAWLVGKPVLSVQPDLRIEALRMLSYKKGVIFIDQHHEAEGKVKKWLNSICNSGEVQIKSELEIHKNAATNVAQEVTSLYRI